MGKYYANLARQYADTAARFSVGSQGWALNMLEASRYYELAGKAVS